MTRELFYRLDCAGEGSGARNWLYIENHHWFLFRLVLCPQNTLCGASMWSSNFCNALNSGMKLAVLQQTSNTLIIDESLLGGAALYHTANKRRNK